MATRERQKIAGRYALGRLIGSARTGEVFEARDLQLERDVAIKILRSCDVEDPSQRRAIEASAHRAARLLHPNVVTVYDGGVADGTAFVVLERQEDVTLENVLRTAPLPGIDVRRLGLDLLAALEAAHDAGIVHGDVTPAQVLHASDGRWKLGGFGEPAHIPGGEGPRSATNASHRFTPKDDIYMTGLVLFTAATGLASVSPSSAGSGSNGKASRPLRAQPLRPDLDPALANAIDRATGADPDHPFSGARTMFEALRNSGGARPLASAPIVELTPRESTRPRAALDPPVVVDLTAAEAATEEPAAPAIPEPRRADDAGATLIVPDAVIMPPPPDGESAAPVRSGSRRARSALVLAGLLGISLAAAGVLIGQSRENPVTDQQAVVSQGSELSAATIDVGEGRGGVAVPVDDPRPGDDDRSKQNRDTRNDGGKEGNGGKGDGRGGGDRAEGAPGGGTTGSGTSSSDDGGTASGGSGGGGGDQTSSDPEPEPDSPDPSDDGPSPGDGGGDNADPGGGGGTPPGE
ncbi:MAG: protein kinase [Actinomycetota bacterium]